MYGDVELCVYICHRTPLCLKQIPFVGLKDYETQQIQLQVDEDDCGYGFPAVYRCHMMIGNSHVQGGSGAVLLLSSKPGHSGLLKKGEKATVDAYVFDRASPHVIYPNPCSDRAITDIVKHDGFC